MLHRRLLVGIVIILILTGLCCLDVRLSTYGAAQQIPWLPRGIILQPLYLLCLLLLTREVLRILNAAGLHPYPQTVYIGNLIIASSCWLANAYQHYQLNILHHTSSPGGWHWAATASFCALLAVAAAVVIAFAAEMRRSSGRRDNQSRRCGVCHCLFGTVVLFYDSIAHGLHDLGHPVAHHCRQDGRHRSVYRGKIDWPTQNDAGIKSGKNHRRSLRRNRFRQCGRVVLVRCCALRFGRIEFDTVVWLAAVWRFDCLDRNGWRFGGQFNQT